MKLCCEKLEHSIINPECGVGKDIKWFHHQKIGWWIFYDGGVPLMPIEHCPYCGDKLP